jgi:hypothetical protein
MDVFIIIGCIILSIIFIGYIFIKTYMHWYKNPQVAISRQQELPITANSHISINFDKSKSIVTHTYLGKRGDMGNQIFQIACVIAAAKRSEATVILPPQIDDLPINQLFNLSSLPRQSIIPDQTYYEYDNYEEIEIPSDGRIYDIRGYRQAYKYFEDQAPEIRKVFAPRSDLLDKVRAIVPDAYLAIHIRRGDYIKAIHQIPLLREFKQCQLNYYKSGIQLLRSFYPELPILVCTDSPKWVTPFLSELDSTAKLAPTISDISPKFTDFCTLYLAKGVVISNSTYSWWAAYLQNDRPVICPTPWWDPRGFIGSGMGLNGPYLHYPEWWLLDADTGGIKRHPHSKEGEPEDTNADTLDLYRMIRGILL